MRLGDRAARLLSLLEPERAHRLALSGVAARRPAPAPPADPRLAVEAIGLKFPSPVGLAAGFDKNGVVADAMLALGFGFVEIGTVTPLPQAGNPHPRLFRLARDRALINRLGFNNDGHEAAEENLDSERAGRTGIVGVNVGFNRDSDDRIYDYVAGIRRFGPLASYLAINISSPNTPGLRALQEREALAELMACAGEARDAARQERGGAVPLFLKIAPDLADQSLSALIEVAVANEVDGLIIANTTLARPQLKSKHAGEQGGLSGRPLFDLSTAMVARARQLAGPDLVLIGVGGVDDAATAWSKIAAGADLVQLYTGLVYEGPSLPRRISAGLAQRLDERNIADIRAVRGIETERWAAAWPAH